METIDWNERSDLTIDGGRMIFVPQKTCTASACGMTHETPLLKQSERQDGLHTRLAQVHDVCNSDPLKDWSLTREDLTATTIRLPTPTAN